MRLSISNIGWFEDLDEVMYQYIAEHGFAGIEIAPTRIFPENPYESLEQANKWAKQLFQQYQLSVSSMQSIWYGRTENIFESEESRDVLLEYTKKAIHFASNIGCNNLVFGCPKNRNRIDGRSEESCDSFFYEIAEYAKKLGTVFAMEPNPTIYNTNFINETSQALDLVKRIQHPNFKVNLDLGTIIQNEEKVELLKDNIAYINHVHISEPYLEQIQPRQLHFRLKELLESEGYEGFVSIEMKNLNSIDKVKDTMEYVKGVFA